MVGVGVDVVVWPLASTEGALQLLLAAWYSSFQLVKMRGPASKVLCQSALVMLGMVDKISMHESSNRVVEYSLWHVYV